MIESKQITITAPNEILKDFDSTIKKLNQNEAGNLKRKVTKSGLFTDFMLKFIIKNKSK